MKEKLSKLEEELKELSPEEQKQKVNEFMKTLSPEELSQMKQGQCAFCLIAQGKVPAKKIYEDSKFLGVLDIRPANPGHVVLFPKKHLQYLSDLSDDEVSEIFVIANKIGNNLVKNVKAQGINIYVASGQAAGQQLDHIVIHIIPRFQDDKINFVWEGKEIGEEDLERIKGLIKLEKKTKKPVKEKIKKEKVEIERIP